LKRVLILFYSVHGSTKKLADVIAQGVESEGVEAVLRTVPRVSATHEATSEAVPSEGAPFVTLDDINECDGLVLGSPTRFGNMAAPLKYFLDSTTETWVKGTLVGKPASVFTSSTSQHGGQESTLLSMMVPLLHHGMIICGIPYSEPALHETRSGGSPYGATHVSSSNTNLTDEEKRIAYVQGQRMAKLAKKQLQEV
jgi:NAD(P)H dehydrogenase (quinone)